MRKRVKTTYLIHHWLGLVAGIFLLISSITGSVLVFHHDIDHAQFARFSTLPVPANKLVIDNSIRRMLADFPAADIRLPDLPEDPGHALKYEIRQGGTRKWIFVHPETGHTLATIARTDKRLVHVLLDIHYSLLSGTPGKIIVMLGGLSLIALSITGFILYRRSILKVISFRQHISFKSRRSFFSGLHRVTGVWSLVFNLLLSVTGTWIAYTIVQSALNPVSAGVAAGSSTIVSVDSVLAKVRQDYPEFEINYLRIAGGNLAVLGRLKSDPAYYGATYSNLQVDLSSGKVKSASFVQDKPWHERAITVLKPLHFGDFAGIAVKLLYSFLGLMPGVLAVSGFFIWRCKNYKSDKSMQQRNTLMHYKFAKAIKNNSP